MKARVRVVKFVVGIAVLMFVVGGVAHAGSNEPERIPTFSGQFSYTGQGSEALCFNPVGIGVLEDCSTSGVNVVPINLLDNGAGSSDSKGNSCISYTEADSLVLPVSNIPPLIQLGHSVSKVVSYDSATGTGDSSWTAYSGGQCHGATFDHTGATKVASGTSHFVVTADGSRVDSVTTSANTPSNAIASFSTTATSLRQTRSHLAEQ